MIQFSEILLLERKRRRWSQGYLANRLGVKQQSVSNWENGRSLIDGWRVKQLVEVFGADSELATKLDEIDFHAFSYKPKKKRIDGRLLRQWVGLTLDDMDALEISKEWLAGARWAEAKLREKNA